jgi:acyl-coenzyme A synthetase/AMP-(fatty) acid ligase
VLTKPWPGDAARHLGRPGARYKDTYWSRFGPKYYFAGDGAQYDENGNIWLLGRVDDVMNVSGHRLGTMPRSSRPWSRHPKVAEAAVVGRPTRPDRHRDRRLRGKIMRRLLRDIASGRAVGGDTSTLEDFSVLAQLRASDED